MLRSPLTAQLELTRLCNHRCTYCYNPWRENNEISTELFLEDWNKILAQLIANQVFEVVFTGGEPLLKREILYPLLERANKAGLDIKLNSNLATLTEEDISQIKQANVRGVLTSIANYKEETHNRITGAQDFRDVIKNIKRLVDNGIQTGASMVVTRENLDDVYQTGRFLYTQTGLDVFCATPISPCHEHHKRIEITPTEITKVLSDLIRIREDFGVYVDILEPIPRCIIEDPTRYAFFLRRGCSAGKLTIAVSPEGDVRPCTHVSQSYGNLLTEDLTTIWERMIKWRNGSLIPEDCEPCAELSTCSTGCREAARTHLNDYKGKDPWTQGYQPIEQKREVKQKDRPIKNTDQFTVAKDLRYRRERKGEFTFFSSSNYHTTIINSPFFDLVQELKENEPFSVKSFMEMNPLYRGEEERLSNAFSFLQNRRIIE